MRRGASSRGGDDTKKDIEILEDELNKTKKESMALSKKFDIVFNENAILAEQSTQMESIKQRNNYTERELKLKEKENASLRDLVKSLDASNCKARKAKQQRINSNIEAGNNKRDRSDAAASSTILLQNLETIQKQSSILQEENSVLTRDMALKELEANLNTKEIRRQRERIRELETELEKAQDNHLVKMKQMQSTLSTYEKKVQGLQKSSRHSETLYKSDFATEDSRSTLIGSSASSTFSRQRSLNAGTLTQRSPGGSSSNSTSASSRRGKVTRSGTLDVENEDHAFILYDNEDPNQPVLHTIREIHATKAIYVSEPAGEEAAAAMANSTSRFNKTRKLVGSVIGTVRDKLESSSSKSKKHVHKGSKCDGCNKSPITGNKWSCATCENVDLCDKCYSFGIHGYEHREDLFARVESIVVKNCKSLRTEAELLSLIRYDICKLKISKFTFCLSWIADLVDGKSTKELKARALEIPRIRPDVRDKFVSILTRVVGERKDIDFHAEWKAEDDTSSSSSGATSEREKRKSRKKSGDERETLRIWVKDKFKQTSPFLERNKAHGSRTSSSSRR